MDKVDVTKRRLIQASSLLGSAAVLGMSLKTQARTSTVYTSFSDYEQWDMTAMADLLRQGDVSPLELTDAAISRFEANAKLNMVAVNHFEHARDQAARLSKLSTSARSEQMNNAPLLGIPFAFKDLGVSMAGTVTTNGCRFLKIILQPQTRHWLIVMKPLGLISWLS